MPLRSPLSSLCLAGLAATAVVFTPATAGAQGLIDFLWGGGQEWGGSRQVVSFDPQYSPNQIIVSFGDRRLYLLTKRGQAVSYPIAVPREQSRWQGRTTVTDKKINPSWRPTPDMFKENPKLPSWVPGGHPMNPLGVRAMYLGASTYRIHGTDAPWTIGQAVSKGCIRMFNEDVLDLYPRVPVGMRVTVTWQRFPTDGSRVTASSDAAPYGDDAQPVANTASVDSRRTIRALPPLPRRDNEADAGLPDDFVSIDADGNAIPTKKPAKAKPKVTEAAPDKASAPKSDTKKDARPTAEHAKSADGKTADAKPAAATKAPEPVTAVAGKADAGKQIAAEASQPDDSSNAVEVAQKAAAAAARAAQVAREAAEAAKKAAADAKRATNASDTSEEPEQDVAKTASRAAL